MKRKTFDFDWISIMLYVALTLIGWLTIYAVSSECSANLFDTSCNHGKQFVWMMISLVAAVVILAMDNRFLEAISFVVYGLGIFLLILVLVIGKEVHGAKSWIIIGGLQLQPTEFAKVATAMALAKFMSRLGVSMANWKDFLTAAAIVAAPAIIILLQNDTGSALVFGSFLIVFYRAGLNPIIPIFLVLTVFVCTMTLGVGNQLIVVAVLVVMTALSFVLLYNKRKLKSILLAHLLGLVLFTGISFGTDLFVNKVLAEHQQTRIMVLFDPEIDPRGAGYNITQSKIAIGSGGFVGKGFLEGNYTKARFVPMQVTDFIFCTIGEEQGWIGTAFVLTLFFALLIRIYFLAENSKTRYARVYGYGALSILFFHVLVNVGMTIGFVPVIGIPLPLFSYGGSSLLAFTILIFILINHYSHRINILGGKD